MPKMEDLGKTARILEHISKEQATSANYIGIHAKNPHSERKSTNLQNNAQRLSTSSSASQTAASKITQLNQQANPIHYKIDAANIFCANNIDQPADNKFPADSCNMKGSKLDKRRRRLAEQPVLSQDIPGYKGEQDVDSLVKFIEVSA